mmetsp:Transcript_8998/g.10401  ORF Transcript_8998/g.10401 Transcript_8998/m.10401 type:complete len:213 (+) Transcript_8998:174-812(+)
MIKTSAHHLQSQKRFKSSTQTPPGEGALFWIFLVYVPCVIAFVFGNRSVSVTANLYIAACFSLASTQCIAFDWWVTNVEGDLGMPRFIHVGAGLAELVVVAIRMYHYFHHDESKEYAEDSFLPWINTSSVLTMGLMGGAFWIWPWGVKKMTGCIPACFVVLATVLSTPRNQPTIVYISEAITFLVGNATSAYVWTYYNSDNNNLTCSHKRTE